MRHQNEPKAAVAAAAATEVSNLNRNSSHRHETRRRRVDDNLHGKQVLCHPAKVKGLGDNRECSRDWFREFLWTSSARPSDKGQPEDWKRSRVQLAVAPEREPDQQSESAKEDSPLNSMAGLERDQSDCKLNCHNERIKMGNHHEERFMIGLQPIAAKSSPKSNRTNPDRLQRFKVSLPLHYLSQPFFSAIGLALVIAVILAHHPATTLASHPQASPPEPASDKSK